MDQMAVTWLLWGALSILVYTYLGYPAVLALLARRRPKVADPRPAVSPTVTVIVAAYNEERWIAHKIHNVLEQDYAPDQIEVIVVSDGSTDGTEAIVRGLEGPRVRLLRQPQQYGKNAALNRGTAVAHGDIVVFTDANALLAPGALRRLVAPFSDPVVGLVSGQGCYGELGDHTAPVVSNAYVRYEAFIKHFESCLGFVAAADGALYAMRRELCEVLPVSQVHDLFHPIHVVLQGYRCVFVPEAYTVEPASQNANREYQRQVRIIAQGFRVFLSQTPVLLRHAHLKVWWMLLSHRFLRWGSAVFLLVALATNAALLPSQPVYVLCMTGQLVFYMLAAGGAIAEHYRLPLRLLAVPYYFCMVSVAGVGGFLRCLTGQKQAVWTPTGDLP